MVFGSFTKSNKLAQRTQDSNQDDWASGSLSIHQLASLESLELRSRGIVEGFMQGMHASPFVGYSVEFSSHRLYAPGDDPRHVNWKLYARNRKLYVKEFDAETNLNMHIIVDASASMRCKAGSPLSKWEYATALAASLARIAMKQHDAIGLTLVSDRVIDHVDPSSRPGRWDELLKMLSREPTEQSTGLGPALSQAAAMSRRCGVVFVISDLIDDPVAVMEGLRQLRFRKHDVTVFQLLDPWERSLPEPGKVRFADLEGGEEVITEIDSIRPAYTSKLDQWIGGLRQEMLRQSIDLCSWTTDRAPSDALVEHLVNR